MATSTLWGKALWGCIIKTAGNSGLTDMPAIFQRALDKTFSGLRSTFYFLDDILEVYKRGRRRTYIVSKTHAQKMNSEPFSKKIAEGQFMKYNTKLLDICINKDGSKPLSSKLDAIAELEIPKTQKNLID